jgi:hypothetical protein
LAQQQLQPAARPAAAAAASGVLLLLLLTGTHAAAQIIVDHLQAGRHVMTTGCNRKNTKLSMSRLQTVLMLSLLFQDVTPTVQATVWQALYMQCKPAVRGHRSQRTSRAAAAAPAQLVRCCSMTTIQQHQHEQKQQQQQQHTCPSSPLL